MKILLIGKSAREHVFAQKLSESKNIEKIFCIPGNPAIAEYAECINVALDDLTSIKEFAKENKIDLTIALDEYVIQNGIANIFRQENLKIFAPTQEAAQIGTSRAFAKKFLYKNKIPTPKYGIFDKEATALEYLKNSKMPVIIKYDHLAHQDSFVCKSFSQAKNTLSEVFERVQKKVIIEEYLEGETVTFSIIADGYNVLPFPYVKEYKKTKNNKLVKAIGAYCPFSKITSRMEDKIVKEIVFPIIDSLQKIGTPYIGFLSINLLISKENIYALEFLPTFSIAEATCALPLINDDLLKIILLATNGALEDYPQSLSINDDTIVSAALMSGDYPDNPKINSIVNSIENIEEDNIELFYNDAGINSDYKIVTTGGRAFFLTAKAKTLSKASQDLYKNIDIIDFDGKNYLKNIGKIPVFNNY